MTSDVHGFFQDEEGNWSMGRILLTASLALTFVLIYLDALWVQVAVPVAAYGLLGTVDGGLLLWAAGPRMAKYLAGPMAGMVGAITSGVSKVTSWTRPATPAPPPPPSSDPSEYDKPPPGGGS